MTEKFDNRTWEARYKIREEKLKGIFNRLQIFTRQWKADLSTQPLMILTATEYVNVHNYCYDIWNLINAATDEEIEVLTKCTSFGFAREIFEDTFTVNGYDYTDGEQTGEEIFREVRNEWERRLRRIGQAQGEETE